jgi:hypothetical protein
LPTILRSPVWPDPRIKPPHGAVEIDWSHPLAVAPTAGLSTEPARLTACLLFNTSGGVLYDLVGRRVANRSVSMAEQRASAVGPVYQKTVADAQSATYDFGGDAFGNTTTSVSAFWIMRESDTSARAVLRAGGANTRNVMWGTYNDAGHRVRYTLVGIWDMTSPFTIGTGAWFAMGASANIPWNTVHWVARNLETGAILSGSTMHVGSSPATGGTSAALIPDGTAVSVGYVWRGMLTLESLLWLAHEPYAFLLPVIRRRWFVPTGAQEIPVGQATESNAAQPVARAKSRTAAQAAETDLAQVVSRRKARSVVLATEADLAQAIARLKRRSVAQALETDLSQAITRVKSLLAAQTTEADLAQAVARLKTLLTAPASELDFASVVVRGIIRDVFQATEVDLAQVVTWTKMKSAMTAVEIDVAAAVEGGAPPPGGYTPTFRRRRR